MLTRRQWLVVALIAVGVIAVIISYQLFNGPPPPSRWPSFYAWDPATGRFVQPLGGPGQGYQTFVLKSWLDEAVPYWPVLAVPYLSFLIIIPLVLPALLLAQGEVRQAFTYGTALIVSQLVMDLAYWMFQTSVIREGGTDGPFGRLLIVIRSGDQPFNAFPSGHAAWTTIAIVALWRMRGTLKKTALVLIPWLVLVYPATVSLRQHYLIDVYAGLFVGYACYWACVFLVERPRLVARES